jgi:hypothetical protein
MNAPTAAHAAPARAPAPGASLHAAAHGAHAGVQAGAQAGPPAGTRAPGQRATLLLIEPDYMLRRTVALTARSLDVGEVHEAGSFEVAARLLDHTRFDGLIVALGHTAPACAAPLPAASSSAASSSTASSAGSAASSAGQSAPAHAAPAGGEPTGNAQAAVQPAVPAELAKAHEPAHATDPALLLIERVRMGATYCDAGTPIAVMAEGLNAGCVATLRGMDVTRILVKPAKVKTILEAVIAIARPRAHAHAHA